MSSIDNSLDGPSEVSSTPQQHSVDLFPEISEAVTIPTPQPAKPKSSSPESSEEAAPGAPLTALETSALRELLRAQLQQAAEAAEAQKFITANPDYKATPENFRVITSILQDNHAEFNFANVSAAFRVAKEQGLLEMPVLAPELEPLERARVSDFRRKAEEARIEEQREEQRASEFANQSVRTALPGTHTYEPPEESESENSAELVNKLNTLPLPEARKLMESIMFQRRVAGGNMTLRDRELLSRGGR